MKIQILIQQIIFGLLSSATVVKADNRSYVWTYEYKTMEKGTTEIEYYLTFKSPFADSLEGTTTTEFNLEIEIGMTDRFDFSIYQIFEQKPRNSVVYKGYKLRSRFRLGEKNQYFMDPLLYLEYKGKPDFSEHSVEGKIILAKNIGLWNVAINPVWEYEKNADASEHKLKYNIGVSYKLSMLNRIGVELKGSDLGHYLGPVITHGREDLWVALGSGFAITTIKDNKPEFMLRMILGIGL